MVDIYVGQENTHWILHEKLLCHRSPYFRSIFYSKESQNHSMGLPDEEDEPFRMFVGWLYSGIVPPPKEEKDLGSLFDLYLMGEKWEVKDLKIEVLETVRNFYHDHETYPALRRVQYVYANTEAESPMRQLLINAVARFLVLGEGMPQQWDKALRKNGQLAVDIILAVQKWKIEEDKVPDPREESVVPIYDDSEHRKEEKEEKGEKEEKEEKDIKEEPKEEEGPNGHLADDEKPLTNGVNGDEH